MASVSNWANLSGFKRNCGNGQAVPEIGPSYQIFQRYRFVQILTDVLHFILFKLNRRLPAFRNDYTEKISKEQ
jgi:hypothetical protein